MKRKNSRINKNKRKNTHTRKQRGAGGCWGGICSTNQPSVNETAYVPGSAGEETIRMQQNPMFNVAQPTASATTYTQETVPAVPKTLLSLTWLWEKANYRFKKIYTGKIVSYRNTGAHGIEYLHGAHDIIRKASYDNVIFVLKIVHSNNKQIQTFLEKASNSIDSLTQGDLDFLNNLIIRDFNKSQSKSLKKEVLDDFKVNCYTYNTNILDPVNKAYTEEITNLFDQLVVRPVRGLINILEKDIQPPGTDIPSLVEGELIEIQTSVKQAVSIASLRGGRKRTRRNKKQRGSGGCWGGICSTNQPAVNESAHVVIRNPYDNIIEEMTNLSAKQAELQNLEIEQMQLESKQMEGLIDSGEQERLNELKSKKRKRGIELAIISARLMELNAIIDELTATLSTAGI